MSGSISLPKAISRANLLSVLVLVSATALSASAPPATLPRGFLEKLPMFLEMPDAEYDALLRTANTTDDRPARQTQPAHKQPERGKKQ